jgi:hypothetical protein
MHAARRRQLDSTDTASAKIRRRRAVTRAKRARERFVRFEARVERDRRDRERCVRQLPRRALDPQSPCELDRRLTDHPAKHTVEVERREAGPSGQRVEGRGLIEMLGHMLDHSLHDLHIERPRLGFHTANAPAPRSTALDTPC